MAGTTPPVHRDVERYEDFIVERVDAELHAYIITVTSNRHPIERQEALRKLLRTLASQLPNVLGAARTIRDSNELARWGST